MYREKPFGNPDGARADLKEVRHEADGLFHAGNPEEGLSAHDERQRKGGNEHDQQPDEFSLFWKCWGLRNLILL